MRVSGVLACALTLAVAAGVANADLTFLHLSDVHTPYAFDQARETVAALPRGEVTLAPYDTTVAAPSLAIVTGDLTEFGGGSGWEQQYLSLWDGLPYPVYHETGNHDNTWACLRPMLRRLHGSPFYAFEADGVKFIGWDDSSPQDPRASVAAEGLSWLRGELSRTPPHQPIIFFSHHPLDSGEFAGGYDRARLLDLLQARNVVLLLCGHGHGARAWTVAGMDCVMGGCAYGDSRGFGVVSISGGRLRVCHQFVAAPAHLEPLLDKPLAGASPFVQVASIQPADGWTFAAGEPLVWRVRTEPADAATGGRWALGEQSGELRWREGAWEAQVPAEAAAPGAQAVTLELNAPGKPTTTRTLAFWTGNGRLRVAWKQALTGSCQGRPCLVGDRVYVGCNDGSLYALDAGTGNVCWRTFLWADVRGGPVASSDGHRLFVASSDGMIRALDTFGNTVWRYASGAPIYAPVTLADDALLCPTNTGEIICLDAASGALRWRTQVADYSIESAVAVGDGMVFAGAWDCDIHAVALRDGSKRWQAVSKGSDRSAAARYYSPADCAPVFCRGRVFVADRGYFLTVLDAATGRRLRDEPGCAAVAPTEDGAGVYVRHSDNRLSRYDAQGSVVWSVRVPTGSVACPPTECAGKVWSVSSLGTLSCLDATNGEPLASCRVLPDLWAFAEPACGGSRAYVTDMGGNVVALELPQPDRGR